MTATYSRLLLATEHTEFDVGAERVAFALAMRHRLPLAAVVPMLSNPVYEVAAPELVARAEQEIAGRIAALREAATAAGVTLDIHVRRGDQPWREIVAEAAQRESDLIVARRRGNRGFMSRLMLGEMVGNVALHAPCSVLLVPRACGVWTRRVLAGVDGGPAMADVARYAGRLAVEDALPLTIVGVAMQDTREAREAAAAVVASAEAIAAKAGAQIDSRVVEGRPRDAITQLAAEVGADLVVIGRRGEASTLKRLMLGSTTRGVVEAASYPVLIVGA
ncbi:MAG: universal stress protein [Burkholderiales bacterium]|nr:universal stress protein [Burkholderiales bacterium]